VPRTRPEAWPALAALALALLLMQVGARLALAASASPDVLVAAIVSASAFVAVAVAGARLSRRALPAPLRFGPSTASAAGVATAVIGMVGLSVALGSAADAIGLGGGDTAENVARALSDATPGRRALAVAAVAVVPGVAEETFFRGLVQTRLVARWGRWPGIAATAAAFGLVHLDVIQGSLAALAGLFLGWVTERFESIRPSIAAHATNNAIFVVLAPWMAPGALPRSGEAVAACLGAAVFACAVALLRSGRAVRASEHRDAPHERSA
jgi:membrane protease YdiL (CAAX protease family)